MRTAQTYSSEVTKAQELKEVRNPAVQLSEAEASAFTRLHERRLRGIARRQALERAGRPAQHMRDFKTDATALMMEAIPAFSSSRRRLLDKYTAIFGTLRPDQIKLEMADGDRPFDDVIDQLQMIPRPPRGIGEFWWARTSTWSTMDEFTVALPDQQIRIYGHLHWGGDELITGSFGYIEDYVLTPDRFPTDHEITWHVSPSMHVDGVLSGFTGFYHPWWAADDKWSKCWENIRCTVSLSTGEVFQPRGWGYPRMDLDDVSPVGQANYDLTSDQGETVRFYLDLPSRAAAGTSILLQVERWYEVHLEGDADVWFWRYRGQPGQSTIPGPDNAVMCQTAPIFLQPR